MRLARCATWVILGLTSCARSGNHDPFLDDPTQTAAPPDASDAQIVLIEEDASTTPDKGDAGAVRPEDAALPKDAAKDSTSSHDSGADSGASGDSGSACTKVGPSNVCGLAPQCGCGVDGTCDVVGTNGETACVNPAGIIPQGGYCTQTAGCQAGLTCRYGGICHSFCTTAGSDCPGPNVGKCVQAQNGDAGVPNFLVCEIKCALEDANACGAGAGCFESQINPGTTDCYQVGTTALDGACTYLDDCTSGLGCVSVNNGAGKCKRWCRVGTTDCGGTVACQGLTPQFTLNGSQYGFCP